MSLSYQDKGRKWWKDWLQKIFKIYFISDISDKKKNGIRNWNICSLNMRRITSKGNILKNLSFKIYVEAVKSDTRLHVYIFLHRKAVCFAILIKTLFLWHVFIISSPLSYCVTLQIPFHHKYYWLYIITNTFFL